MRPEIPEKLLLKFFSKNWNSREESLKGARQMVQDSEFKNMKRFLNSVLQMISIGLKDKIN